MRMIPREMTHLIRFCPIETLEFLAITLAWRLELAVDFKGNSLVDPRLCAAARVNSFETPA